MKNEKIVLSTIAHCRRLKSFRTSAALILATLLLVVTATTGATAQILTTLHSFDGGDGANPYARLVQAANGDLYGTTYWGGANDSCGNFNGCGTVFKITPSGTLTTLYSFCAKSDCADGFSPYAGLIQAADGNLYGTTFGTGDNGNCGNFNSCGTVFKITPSGTLTLHSFDGTDGAYPNGGLAQATNGNLYGTTGQGGANGPGTVFKITPSGTLTTLYNFCSQSNCTDGAFPYAGLVQATNGNLYGTTSGGGANNYGTVFKITPSGTLTTLHSFDVTDGAYPQAGLVQATDGNLYGTTGGGGANNDGTVFKITPGGTLTTLHSFDGTDGAYPNGELVQATDGKLYGTTVEAGANSAGTVFKITPGGTLTTLHNFCSQSNCPDGASPYAALVQDTNGTFYGTTELGGANREGTVFSLSVGLGPFVETQTTSGKVGAAVKILGTELTGATSVSFNGTVAVFKVVSKSLITTTVPEGATTGTVKVKTPHGTLKSNVVFRVMK